MYNKKPPFGIASFILDKIAEILGAKKVIEVDGRKSPDCFCLLSNGSNRSQYGELGKLDFVYYKRK